MRPMDMTFPGKTENAVEEIRRNTRSANDGDYKSISANQTPLENELSETRKEWLTQYVCDRFRILHNGLFHRRAKMEIWEAMSKDDYSHRITEPNSEKPDISPDIFRMQNGSMGLSAGFTQFAGAQARNDIFGTYPWLAANPEGREDRELADTITKHAQWKTNQSNLEATLIDAIQTACWGGTAFCKVRWDRQVETYRKAISAAYSISAGDFLLGPDGDFITDPAVLEAMGVDGADIQWKDRYIREELVAYDNIRADLLDYRDVAFDEKAPELDLTYTDVFTRFRIGLLDAIATYNIPEEYIGELRAALVTYDEEARGEDGETSGTTKMPGIEDDEANPTITLVEGFVRCNPTGGSGAPSRIHVVCSPELHFLFRADYLANVTPAAILPIFPCRIHKIARRIFGRGFFEKYEQDNDAVDRHHNTTTHRNQLSSNVIVAFQPEALLDESEGKDGPIDINKPFVLKPDKTINDLISFAVFPDVNNRSIDLMNHRLQMAQMRSGITSAAQGELKGVPTASTATGVMQMQSRGALLLKEQVDTLAADIEKCVEYCVHLIYANLDTDEVFTWGEGSDSALFTIRAGDVQGLRMNVSLTLVQAQMQAKFQSAHSGISIAMQYTQLPEHEKTSQRLLYIEALHMLGFHEAQDIIRPAVVDISSLLALLPPEEAAQVQMVLAQAGLVEPPEGMMAAPPAAMPAEPPIEEDVTMQPADAPVTEAP
jgi:hypothetical protein